MGGGVAIRNHIYSVAVILEPTCDDERGGYSHSCHRYYGTV